MSRLIQSLRSLWYWLPVIWNDRPWDYWYLLKIWKHKVEQMEAATSEWLHVDAEDVAIEMRQTIGLIQDLMDDRAEDEAIKRHEEIFGKPVRTFKPDPDNPLLVEMVTTYPDADDQEVARLALVAFADIALLAREVTLAALGRSIQRIERWWD